ncbi:MAG: PASTA domain-containing protein, partial [Lachnospiraceae bacterium]|nr:PASTA domain-containing protein [Lachnospiraceae bacterium]
VRVTHDTIPANVIISIDPVNVTVAQGDKVVITYSGGPNYATVPELRGKTLDQAMKALEEVGLMLGEVSQDYSDEYAKDLISAQQHPSGNRLKNGTKVNVTVSLGPKKAMIPADLLINQDGTRNSYGAVKQRLESLGYVVVRKEVYDAQHGAHSSDDSAYVISVTPAPGSEYAYGNEVTVVTATDSRILPDFSGKNYKEVAEMLSRDPYGFAVEPIYVAAQNSGQEGLIETQNPKAGSEWEKGMYITLTVYTMGMIDMKGMKAEEARSFIEEKGWVYYEVPGEYIDDATAGTVLSTDPKGGTFPEPGATITVTVAASKEEPVTEPPTDPPTEPPTEPPTDPPTEPPTEPPTDLPTEPTEPPTEPPTDPPTETEPVTETAPPGSDPPAP